MYRFSMGRFQYYGKRIDFEIGWFPGEEWISLLDMNILCHDPEDEYKYNLTIFKIKVTRFVTCFAIHGLMYKE